MFQARLEWAEESRLYHLHVITPRIEIQTNILVVCLLEKHYQKINIGLYFHKCFSKI